VVVGGAVVVSSALPQLDKKMLVKRITTTNAIKKRFILIHPPLLVS
jgi:hypothetical protein